MDPWGWAAEVSWRDFWAEPVLDTRSASEIEVLARCPWQPCSRWKILEDPRQFTPWRHFWNGCRAGDGISCMEAMPGVHIARNRIMLSECRLYLWRILWVSSRICIVHSMPLRGCSPASEKDSGRICPGTWVLHSVLQVFGPAGLLRELRQCCRFFVHSGRVVGNCATALCSWFRRIGEAMDGSFCSRCLASALIQPAWRKLDGATASSDSISHQRHCCLLLLDGNVSFSCCPCVLQFANP